MPLPIRVAVIGAGFMGAMHARTLARSPQARVTHIVDLREAAATGLAPEVQAQASIDAAAILANPEVDAVVIALPDTLHVDAAVAAVRAGKAVLLEKPMAHDLAGATAIARAAAEGPGRLMVGHLCRFDPRYRRAALLVAEGAVGEPVHLAISRFCQHPGRRAVGSHLCWLMGIHDLDLIHWLTGRRVTRVYARAKADCLPEMAFGVDDVVMALFDLEGGALVQLAFGWTLPSTMPAGLQAGLRLVGTKGVIEVKETDDALMAVTTAGTTFPDTRYWPEFAGRIEGSLRAEDEHFVDAVRTGSGFLVPNEAALDAVAVSDAVLASLRSGNPEPVRYPEPSRSLKAG